MNLHNCMTIMNGSPRQGRVRHIVHCIKYARKPRKRLIIIYLQFLFLFLFCLREFTAICCYENEWFPNKAKNNLHLFIYSIQNTYFKTRVQFHRVVVCIVGRRHTKYEWACGAITAWICSLNFNSLPHRRTHNILNIEIFWEHVCHVPVIVTKEGRLLKLFIYIMYVWNFKMRNNKQMHQSTTVLDEWNPLPNFLHKNSGEYIDRCGFNKLKSKLQLAVHSVHTHSI